MKGIRKTIYIRAADKWVVHAIKAVVAEVDALGGKIDESSVIVDCVKSQLEGRKKTEVERSPIRLKNIKLKRTIQCPVDKAFLFQRVEQIVELKIAAGIPTTFNREFIHLALAGLTADIGYGILTQKLLHNAGCPNEKLL